MTNTDRRGVHATGDPFAGLVPDTPLDADEIARLTGTGGVVQLTRDQLAALPAAERLRAHRAGQTTKIQADLAAEAEQARRDNLAKYARKDITK